MTPTQKKNLEQMTRAKVGVFSKPEKPKTSEEMLADLAAKLYTHPTSQKPFTGQPASALDPMEEMGLALYTHPTSQKKKR